jgi:hypothetical protein
MKKVIALAVVASGVLFAGKNVELAPVAPIDITPATPSILSGVSSNGVALKVGTLGIGVDVEHMFNKKHGLRLNVNGIKVSKSKSIEGIDYDLDLKLFTAGLLYDYYPNESAFRLSAGVYYNGNKIEGHAQPSISRSITIGDKTYTASDKVKVYSKIDFKKVAPYLGIGWSSTELNGWHFTADIGVMYHGKPKAKLKATTKNVAAQPLLDIEAAKEQKQLQDKVEDYKFYPVIMVGIQRKF